LIHFCSYKWPIHFPFSLAITSQSLLPWLFQQKHIVVPPLLQTFSRKIFYYCPRHLH
jgi:hypothetical protein